MEAQGFVLDDEALRTDKRVEFHGKSQVDPGRDLQVVYPDTFSSMPPMVLNDTHDQRLHRHHRPVSGELCLFGPTQRRWSANLDGTVALDEAEDLIKALGNASHVVDDDVPEPVTVSYDYITEAAIIVPPALSSPMPPNGSLVTVGQFRLRWQSHPQPTIPSSYPGRGMVESTVINGVRTMADGPFSLRFASAEMHSGALFLVPEPPPFVRNMHELILWLDGLGIRKEKRSSWMAFVFTEQAGTVNGERRVWLITHRSSKGELQLIRTFPIRNDEFQARIPGLEGLAHKNVAVVGCGSMGSKIAVALAATGVANFGLIDYDIVEPSNSVRHEVGTDQFGSLKVAALADRIINVNPFAHERWKGMLLPIGRMNTLEAKLMLHELLSSADLIVDTTGVHGVSHYINDICDHLGIPSLYASVTDGAWGGEIVRVIPGETACWNCWVNQYHDDAPPAEPKAEGIFFAPGCDQPTFTGTTYDIGMVANMATSVAVETLLRDEPDRKHIQGDYIQCQTHEANGMPHYTSAIREIRRRDDCPICNPT